MTQSTDTTSTIRYLIVDDEPLARQRLADMLLRASAQFDQLQWQCVAQATNGVQALELIGRYEPDVVFLDIQMPGMNGLEVVDSLDGVRPHIVFVTAYDEYALQAFEVHALDYLTKPVRQERLVHCLERISSTHHREQQYAGLNALRKDRARLPLQRISVRDQERIRVLAVQDIERIEAEDKNVQVFSAGRAYRTDLRLDELEARLESAEFIRIHRSHIVRIDAVRELIPWFSGSYCVKLDDGTQLPVARRRAATLKQLLGKV